MEKILKPCNISINEKDKEMLLRIYANDIRLDYDSCNGQEYWIGEKGTTAVQCLLWDKDKNVGHLVCFGSTISELRKDATFVLALLNDGDVLHGLPADDEPIDEELYKEILDFLSGRSNAMPITACGAVNYYVSYLK